MDDPNWPRHIVAVGGLITNAGGEVLLLRNPRRGWEFPGGQVEKGEDIITALKREVEEETGIICSVGRMVGVYSNIKEPVKVMFGFLGEALGGEPRISEESLEVRWVPKGEVLGMITYPTIKYRMGDMLGFDGSVVYRVYRTDPYEVVSEVIV